MNKLIIGGVLAVLVLAFLEIEHCWISFGFALGILAVNVTFEIQKTMWQWKEKQAGFFRGLTAMMAIGMLGAFAWEWHSWNTWMIVAAIAGSIVAAILFAVLILFGKAVAEFCSAASCECTHMRDPSKIPKTSPRPDLN